MKIKQIVAIVFFISFSFRSEGQIVLCDNSEWALPYKIKANSGLKLRDGQSSKSKVLEIIPYEEEIKICFDNSVKDTIDNIEGSWVKTYWNNEEGFIFDGYVEKIIVDPEISIFGCYFSFEWERYKFKNDSYYGLYSTLSQDSFLLQKMRNRISSESEIDSLRFPNNLPEIVFRDFEDPKKRKIKLKEIGRSIYIGEKIPLDKGTLYCSGQLNKRSNQNVADLSIEPYEIWYQENEKGIIKEELLVKMKFIGGINAFTGYETNITINYIGDFDGDKKDDIFVTYQSGYKFWNYGLFSTKYAKAGNRFKMIEIGQCGAPE